MLPALLALALGLWGITREHSLWRDEAATWQIAQRSVAQIWHMVDEVDIVHGLYYLLMHGVFEVFGVGLTALRMPSVLAVALAAAATAAAGRRLAGPWAGLGAGLALALIPNIQHYAQEGRSYALVTGAVAVATLLLVGAADDTGVRGGPRAWGRWTGYTLAVLVAALLNWFSLFVLGAHAVTVFLARRRGGRPLLVRWTVAAAVAVAGALPLVLASRAQADQVSWIKPVAVSTLLGVAAMVLVSAVCARVPVWVPRQPGTNGARRAAEADRISGTGTSAANRGSQVSSENRATATDQAPEATTAKEDRIAETASGAAPVPPAATPSSRPPLMTPASVGLPLLVVPQLGLLLASLLQPIYLDRYVLYTNVGFALLLGLAIGAAVRALPGRDAVLLAGVVAIAFAALLPVELGLRRHTSRVDDVLRAAQEVADRGRPGDGVVFIPAARRDTALVSPSAFAGIDDLALAEDPASSGTVKGVETTAERIRTAMLAKSRILLVTDAGRVPPRTAPAREKLKLRVLADHFRQVGVVETGGRRVEVFEKKR
ncbi:glycosyltransferase family 39 protein [Streptomyces sp. NPDC003077]|uniref:glycosyltransferase family 39 protein n=1 Tax=Streptomyces sp. NPDC003077 TaxID=3154443 RepID=UPI0033BBA2AF